MLQSNQKIIRHKVGLRNLAEELGNVSKACQMMGLTGASRCDSRCAVSTFRWRCRSGSTSLILDSGA